MQNKTNEEIWAVPSQAFKRYRSEHFVKGYEAAWIHHYCNTKGQFHLRSDEGIEKDTNWRQPIPYLLVENLCNEFLLYRRKPAQTESRLVDKWGIGVGGHINPVDTSFPVDDNIYAAAWRELDEETGLSKGALMTFAGALVTNRTEVDRV